MFTYFIIIYIWLYILFICIYLFIWNHGRNVSGRNVSASHQSHSPAFSASRFSPVMVCMSLPECRWSKREPWSTDGLRDQTTWLGLGKMSWDVINGHTHKRYIYIYICIYIYIHMEIWTAFILFSFMANTFHVLKTMQGEKNTDYVAWYKPAIIHNSWLSFHSHLAASMLRLDHGCCSVTTSGTMLRWGPLDSMGSQINYLGGTAPSLLANGEHH